MCHIKKSGVTEAARFLIVYESQETLQRDSGQQNKTSWDGRVVNTGINGQTKYKPHTVRKINMEPENNTFGK